MFESFFPKPKLFFISLVFYAAVAIGIWYSVGDSLAGFLGFDLPEADAPPVIGLGFFVTSKFMWFYLYYTVATLIFWAAWQRIAPHKWHVWSILG